MTSDEFYAKLFCIHSSSYTVAGLHVRVPGIYSIFVDFFIALQMQDSRFFIRAYLFCTMIFAIRLCVLIFRVVFSTRAAAFLCHRKTQKIRRREIKYNKVKGVNRPLNM